MKKILVALLVAMLLLCSAALAEGIAPVDPTAKPTPAPTKNTASEDATPDVEFQLCDHVYDMVLSEEHASCEADGTIVYMCSKCKNATFTVTSNKLEHKWDNATWYNKKDDPNNHYLDAQCSRCGKTKTEKYPHEWKNLDDKNVVDPTCTTAGYRYVICSVCYAEDTVDVKKLGHDVEKDATGKLVPVKVVAPTCFEAGYELYECRRCHETEKKVLAKLQHQYTDWVIAQNPSCVEDGLMYRYCTRPCCSNTVLGKQYKETEVIKAPGHKYDADRLEIVEVKGKKYVTGVCVVCREQAYAAYTGKLPATNNAGNTATGGGNTENSTANKPTTNNAGVTIPATGETTSIAPIMMVLAIAGLAVLAATKQKVNG